MSNWFTAHKEGLKQIAERLVERRGFGIIGGELYQNVMDTEATECIINFKKIAGRPIAELSVMDNDPNGFHDLSHAWTIFAPSMKKSDPTKAGRFNLGEKMVLAFCKKARIHTTKGLVEFNENERNDYPRRKREIGTEFWAEIECSQERYDQFIDYMRQIIVKPGLSLVVNGEIIQSRKPIHSFVEKLPTEIAGKDGTLRKSIRQCEIQIYEALPNETPSLYEMGIPVVETGDRWHYSVLQKVPLNVDRDNVTPAYLRDLRVVVFNQMHNQIAEEDTTTTWVNEATDDEDCNPEAVETYRVMRYGKKSVALDPTNPEANAEAVAHGYTVIPPRGLSSGQRKNLYSAGTLISTSTAFPLAGKGAYSDDPNATPVEVIPEINWSEGMRRIHEYTEGVAYRLLEKRVHVRFVKCKNYAFKAWSACFGRGHALGSSSFDYNVHALGKKWFDGGVNESIDDLILHELAHEYESNHLSEDYYKACTKLGARLKAVAMQDLEWFKSFLAPTTDTN